MIGAAIKAELSRRPETRKYLAGDDSQWDRIYPLLIPQKQQGGDVQTPCVVYSLSSVERQQTYCGTSKLVKSRYDLDYFATSYDEVVALADAGRQVLQDFCGMLGGTVDVRNATLESALELQDIEPGLYRVSQSWVFWHTES